MLIGNEVAGQQSGVSMGTSTVTEGPWASESDGLSVEPESPMLPHDSATNQTSPLHFRIGDSPRALFQPPDSWASLSGKSFSLGSSGKKAVLASNPGKRPTVGVVLAGGGAAGISHVGVLKEIERHGIPIDCIAGTSMGSIVAGLYAAGYSTSEMEQIIQTFPWNEVLVEPVEHAKKYERRKTDDYLFPPAITIGIDRDGAHLNQGLVSGEKLTIVLRRLFASANHISDFDRLPVPFRAVATDLVTGEEIVFSEGNLATAIRASMSIPGVFPPVRYQGRTLVDGGLVNNLPTDVARRMGADILIIVQLPRESRSVDELDNLFSISSQSLGIISDRTSSNIAKGMQAGDILIRPELNGIGTLAFDRATEAVDLGEQAAARHDQQLASLATTLRNFNRSVPGHTELPKPQELHVDRIEIQNQSPDVSNAAIASRITVSPACPVPIAQLERDLERIRGLDLFGIVDYEITVDEAGCQALNIITSEDPLGSTRLSFGLGLEDNFRGDAAYNASIALQMLGLNSLGGEARFLGQLGSRQRLLADFYQPVEPTQRWYVRPFVDYHSYIQPFVFFDERYADFQSRNLDVGSEIGRTLGDYGAAFGGVFYRNTEVSRKTGDPVQFGSVDGNLDSSAFYLGIKHDSLDNYFFPKNGLFAETVYTQMDDGQSRDFIYGRLIAARTYARHTILFRGETVVDDVVAGRWDGEEITTGGFLRLSGYASNQVFASRRAQGAIVCMKQLQTLLSDRVKLYSGASLEAAWFDGPLSNVEIDRPVLAGSIFIAAETPMGPVFAGVGATDTDQVSPFIAMGQVF